MLHIGAHAELRNEYQGNPGSHVCTMRRVVEMCPAVQVGMRSLSEEESKSMPKLPTKVYWAKDIVRAPVKAWIAKVLEDLGPRVYLTVNVDGFDSSIVSSTGAPEPGGLDWYQVTVADPRRGGPQKNRGHGRGRTFAAPARSRFGFSGRQANL